MIYFLVSGLCIKFRSKTAIQALSDQLKWYLVMESESEKVNNEVLVFLTRILFLECSIALNLEVSDNVNHNKEKCYSFAPTSSSKGLQKIRIIIKKIKKRAG